MEILSEPTILLKHNEDGNVNAFLKDSLSHFYQELDFFCIKNDDTKFGKWFSESAFLSMYINGMIRKDTAREMSAVQEYCVSNCKGSSPGRCDGFIERNKNVFLLEAKVQRYNRPVGGDHFDIPKWLQWDKEKIQTQLINYLEAEKVFFLDEGRYQSCYLMTIVFKAIKENEKLHTDNAKKYLIETEAESERIWYYSTAFLKKESDGQANGLEVYGTIEQYVAP